MEKTALPRRLDGLNEPGGDFFFQAAALDEEKGKIRVVSLQKMFGTQDPCAVVVGKHLGKLGAVAPDIHGGKFERTHEIPCDLAADEANHSIALPAIWKFMVA